VNTHQTARPTHISGHPSVIGRTWDRESSSVEQRRSTTVPSSQPEMIVESLDEWQGTKRGRKGTREDEEGNGRKNGKELKNGEGEE